MTKDICLGTWWIAIVPWSSSNQGEGLSSTLRRLLYTSRIRLSPSKRFSRLAFITSWWNPSILRRLPSYEHLRRTGSNPDRAITSGDVTDTDTNSVRVKSVDIYGSFHLTDNPSLHSIIRQVDRWVGLLSHIITSNPQMAWSKISFWPSCQSVL